MRSWKAILRPLDEMFYILIGALALVLGILAMYLNWQKAQQVDLLAIQTRRAVGSIRQLQHMMQEAEAGQRGFLLTGQEVYLDPYRKTLSELDPLLAQLKDLGQSIPAIAERYPEIVARVNEKVSEMQITIQVARFGDWEAANEVLANGTGRQTMERLRQSIAEVESATFAQEKSLGQEAQDKMRLAALIAVFCCVALFLLFAIENHRVASRRRAAEYSSEVKSVFLASMSHELRTPLNAIIGYSQMLQEDAEDAGRKEDLQDLQRIETAGRHLLELINSVLEMSKIDAGKVDIHTSVFPLQPLLDEVIELIRPLASKNQNSLALVVAPGVGSMHSDDTRIRQCLLNLLSNSAKFTQNGSIKLHVERVLEGARPFIRLAVSDTGAGMPPAEMHRLFEPFSQLEAHNRGKGHGTGLGLAITRRLARMLGGDATAESTLGKGSVFTLMLPEEVSPGAIAASVQASPHTRPAVLVIDDDADIHGIVRRLFLRQPLEVASAYDGDEGIRLARRLRPRVILLEVQMERADGWAVLQRLKSDEELAGIPVLLCSFLDVHQDSRAFHAAEILTKPIDLERLSVSIFRHAANSDSRTALIVEDDPAARHSLRQPLEQIGWSVTEAADGMEALERFVTDAPSLIVLDLRLPKLDGFEFLARLRAMESGKSTPVIVVTAMDLDNAQRKRLQQHSASLVPKAGMRSPDLIAQVIASMPAS